MRSAHDLPFLTAAASFFALFALSKQRVRMGSSPISQLGQGGLRSFTAEQFSAEFGLELLYRARQRWLCNAAFVGRAGEVQRS